MQAFVLFGSYFKWHYTRGFVDLYRIARNAARFIPRFFSFHLLIATFFTPWRRLEETHVRKNGIGDFFATLFINTLMRIVGASVRLATLAAGGIVFLFIIASLPVLWIAWALVPFLWVGALIVGLAFIF